MSLEIYIRETESKVKALQRTLDKRKTEMNQAIDAYTTVMVHLALAHERLEQAKESGGK